MELGLALFGEKQAFSSKVHAIRFVTTEGISQNVTETYTCLFDEHSKLFFVNIGKSSIQSFKQSTYLNLVKLAELKQAVKVYFIVTRDNNDKSEYRKAFKLIDLKRVPTDEKKVIFKSDTDYLVYAKEII